MSFAPQKIPLMVQDGQRTESVSRSINRRSLLQISSLVAVMTCGCRGTPQIVDDEEVHKELDALYTAITSRRRNLLDDCHARLVKLHDDGHLSDAGFQAVIAIIRQAESDQWSDAAQRLHDFMRAQRKTKPAR